MEEAGSWRGELPTMPAAPDRASSSVVWQHFTRISTRDLRVVYAACSRCDMVLGAHPKNGTSTLIRHSKKCTCNNNPSPNAEDLEILRVLRADLDLYKQGKMEGRVEVDATLDPWDLPTTRYSTISLDLQTHHGCWKEIKSNNRLTAIRIGQLPVPEYGGLKKTFEFYLDNGTKTDWIMHEYHQLDEYKTPNNLLLEGSMVFRKVSKNFKDEVKELEIMRNVDNDKEQCNIDLMKCSSSLPLPPSLIACSQWQKTECIGSGSFGHVYRGFNSEHGQFCAIKEVLVVLNDPHSKEQLNQLNQEICFLKRFSHPNVVQYYGSILTSAALSIYMEYVSKGSIHVLLRNHGAFEESMIRNYTAQILSGLAYLHERRHIHRDIKGANILVGSNGVVKLADFGLAKHISTLTEVHTSRAGTPYWMAPEVILSKYSGKGYNLSADIWSLGCTVVEMAKGKHPLQGVEPVAAMFKIASDTYEPEIPDKLFDEGKDFLLRCLRRDPKSRPTATQLMDHPFVRDYRAAF